jgi:hypothetical protein
MTDSLTWDEISLEVIHAARICMTVKDFHIQCRLAPLLNGKSFFDRLRVAEALIDSGVIRVEDGLLRIPQGSIPESLTSALLQGSEIAWEILDSLDPTFKFSRKVDQDLLLKIGLNGELAVIDKLKSKLSDVQHIKVRHISLVDDSAGFDIQSPSVNNTEDTVLLEVKTSCRPGDRFTFYISKNEARVGRQNRNWFLVGVEPVDGGYRVIGHMSYDVFSDYLPVNQSLYGDWETAKIVVSKQKFNQGLP